MKKIIFIIICLISISIKANAGADKQLYADNYLNGIYIKMEHPSGYKKYLTAQIIRRKSNNQFVYCLEPYKLVNENVNYILYTNNFHSLAGVSKEKWNYINNLATYGYGYKDEVINHQEDKWWAITQLLIWQEVSPESKIYFTKTLNGVEDQTVFKNEINELKNLITIKSKVPDIKNVPKKLISNQDLILHDYNKTLDNYEINTNVQNITITNDKIVINKVNQDKIYLGLRPKKNTNKPPILYYSPNSQIAMTPGYNNEIIKEINIDVITPKLEIEKYNNSNLTSNVATLRNAIYGVFKSNQKIGEITTNNNGFGLFNGFKEFGSYSIKELKPSEGYLLDNNVYKFNITEDNYNIKLKLPEQLITGQIKVIKDSIYKDTYSTDGAIYEVYDQNNKIVETLTINNNEAISKTLPYGKYYIKEVKAPTAYLLDNKIYEVDVTNNLKTYEIISTEELITGQIKVIKDSIYKDQYSIDGAIYEIRDQNDKLVDSLTIKDNESITKTLPYGKYYIKEVKAPTGYLLDNKIYEVNIFENLKTYEIISKEELITGQIKVIKDSIYKDQYSIDGAIYEVRDQNDKLVDSLTIKDNASITKTLPYGKYFIKEVKAPTGYLLDNKIYEVNITKNLKTYEIISQEKIITGTIKIIKTDKHNNRLANATFALHNSKTSETITKVTDKNGEIFFENVLYGNYFIEEIIPPVGYKLTNQLIECNIISSKEFKEFRIINKEIPPLNQIKPEEVNKIPEDNTKPELDIIIPDTKKDNKLYLLLIVGLFILWKKEYIK